MGNLEGGISNLKNISLCSARIFSGEDVSSSIGILKEEELKFENFLKVLGEKVDLKEFLVLWKEAVKNINVIMKNERGSKEFFRAYSDLNNISPPMIEGLEGIKGYYKKKFKSEILISFALSLFVIFSLIVTFFLFRKSISTDFKRKRYSLKNLLIKIEKEIEEMADEIEEISTKTIKLSLRKSENGYSLITSSLEEMRRNIDSFLKKSFVNEGKGFEENLQNLIDSLSLSLNDIIAKTMVEMEKFKDMEKNIEKISGKISYLKKKVADISLSLKNKEKEI